MKAYDVNYTPKDQPWAGIPPTGPILRPKSAARLIGLSCSHYYALAAKGVLPKPIRIGLRASGVPETWLLAVLAARAEGE